MINIRKSIADDYDDIWEILKEIIRTGDTFAFSPGTSKQEMLAYRFSERKHTYTALLDGHVAGTFFLTENQPGLGSHIANGVYATSPKYAGKGVGRQMGIFSLNEARILGFQAIQFNSILWLRPTHGQWNSGEASGSGLLERFPKRFNISNWDWLMRR